MTAVNWNKLVDVRTILLVIIGFGALVVAAFMWSAIAGWAAIGISALLIAYLTDDNNISGSGRRT